MSDLDRLQIQIKSDATMATKALDNLIARLDILSVSLGKINGSNLIGLSTGVQRLGTAMQTMNAIKTTDFTRLTRNLSQLGTVNHAGLNSTSSALNQISRAFKNVEATTKNVQSIGLLASNLSKLGYKSIDKAVTNIPLLANSLNQLMVTLSKAPTVSGNVIAMTNALANLASQGKNVGSATSLLVGGLGRTRSSMTLTSKSAFSLAAAFGRFYANYFLFLRAFRGLWKAITSTSDYIEAFNYYNVAFGKIASEWDKDWEKYGYSNAEEYAKSFTGRLNESFTKMSGIQFDEEGGLLSDTGLKNLGLNIKEITQYASQLASVTNSVGQTGEVSLVAARSFTKLGADISSLFNIDYSSVMQNLQSGLIGQSRALYKYGIDITNATLQTYAYNLGLSKSVSEMTQAEKMQLRMIAILDQSKVSWGDLANTINSPSNMVRQFKNNLSELGMVFGQLFIPVLQKVLPVLNGLTIALKNLFVSLANVLGIKVDISDFGQGYTELEEDIDGVSDALDDATASVKKFKSATIGIDKLNIISPNEDNEKAGAGGLASTIDLTDEIIKASDEYERVWNEAYEKMENKAQKIAKRITKALKPVTQIFKDFAVGDYFKAGEDVSKLVVSINEFFAKAIKNVDWQKIGANIGKFLEGINWTEILLSIGDIFWSAFTAVLDLTSSAFKVAPIETVLIASFATLKFTKLGKLVALKISTSIAKYLSLGSIFGALTAGIKGLLGNTAAISALAFMDKVTVTFAGVGSVVSGAFLTLYNFVKMLADGFSWLNEVLMVVGAGLTAVGAVILGVPASIAAATAGIVAGIATAAVLIKDNWETIKAIFARAGEWFITNVTTPVSKAFTKLKDNIVKIFEGTWIIIKAVWISVSSWFNDTVATPVYNAFEPQINAISDLFKNAWESIKRIWGGFSNWFTTNITEPLPNLFEEASNKISGLFDGLWEGLKNGVIGAMNSIIAVIESGINMVGQGINGLLSGFNEVVKWASGITGDNWKGVELVQKVTLPRIPAYATGGFPEDGLFYANHNELVGQFANGKTAVVNNPQIIAGIERGVENALMKVALNGAFGGGENVIHNHISLDGREVAENTNRYNANKGTQIFGNQTNYNFGY